MENTKHCNYYLAVYCLDPKDPCGSMLYDEWASYVIPKRDNLVKRLNDRMITHSINEFQRVKVYLKDRRDNRKILDKDEFYL